MADRMARNCVAGALTREAAELVVDLGRCTGCGRCIELSEGVAQPSGEFLLATGDRAELLKRVQICGDREVPDDDR